MATNNYYKIRILQSADEILKHQGIKGLTVSNIVDKCSISKRSFYECFHDKNELLSELRLITNSNLEMNDEKQAILNIAERAISRHGFNHVNLEMIAHAAGLKRGMIYKYFNDKYELLETCIDSQFAKLKVMIRQTYRYNENDPIGFITQYIEGMSSYINYSLESSLYAEVWSHIKFRQKIKEQAEGMQSYIKEFFVECIESGIQKGVFRQDVNANLFAEILLITINGMAYYLGNSSNSGQRINRELTDGIIKFFLSKLVVEDQQK